MTGGTDDDGLGGGDMVLVLVNGRPSADCFDTAPASAVDRRAGPEPEPEPREGVFPDRREEVIDSTGDNGQFCMLVLVSGLGPELLVRDVYEKCDRREAAVMPKLRCANGEGTRKSRVSRMSWWSRSSYDRRPDSDGYSLSMPNSAPTTSRSPER
jgi:hypothetical protein